MKTGPKMDALVAEKVMLWNVKTSATTGWGGSRRVVKYTDLTPTIQRVIGGNGGWSPSSEITAAFEMETEIERRGLKQVYAHELFRLIAGDFHDRFVASASIFWLFAHAFPEQRCRAALACVEGK